MRIKVIFLIFIFLILSNSVLAEIYFSEIMYSPIESNYYNEWIEVYNKGTETIYIENLTLCNQQLFPGFINHTDNETYLNNFTAIEPNQYAIITDGGSGTDAYNNFDINKDSISMHTEGATLCGGLNNQGELITIYYNNELIDAIHYYPAWGADDNGKSLCSINSIWKECNPTPGSENIEQQSTTNYTLRITEFLPNPEGSDTANMPDGEWIELFNYGENEINLIELILKDNTNRELVITNTNIIKETIDPQEYLVVYMNGIGLLNNEGFEKIRLLTSLEEEITQVTYYGSKEGTSWSLIDLFWKSTKPSPNEENINEEIGKQSNISIDEIYLGSDNKAKFGDNLRVKLDIYKGNTTKEEIKIYLEKEGEKISKITRFKVSNIYTNHILTVPIQIFPNCNSKYEEGNYNVIVEGLDESNKDSIKIEGITENLCETKIVDEDSKSIINVPKIQSEAIYESTSTKSERTAIYFFCFVLVLVIVKTNTKKWKKSRLKQ
jgi:hypothetical protein